MYFVITDHHNLRIILVTIVIKKLSHFETNLLSIVGRRVGPKVTVTLVSKDNHIIIIVTPIIMIIILMMIMITNEIVKVTVEVRVMLTRTIILILIIYMKKKITRA